eukprot:CAMPEP_0172474452 /NCGR_PEP_ID=MMETSP1065-20121228/69364_1 /TAXON_ID=265537 /ORGANISM="Amphiprora paludosa, Strain CCMP125" /LENGTH=721 /DNA_ID=CAMNT_0013232633 /DNA_START=2514 /DNA_END=4679 /DNA_ORIENTATION=-
MDERSMVSGGNTPSSAKLMLWSSIKLMLAASFVYAAYVEVVAPQDAEAFDEPIQSASHRRLAEFDDSAIPSYMEPMMEDLQGRKKLFQESPKEEVKYWFEYSGPLQKYYYRFSKQRGKADYFEGRDDSGVVSSRFIPAFGANKEYQDLFLKTDAPDDVRAASMRLYENCLALGSSVRPKRGSGTTWDLWYGKAASRPGEDRCRVLFALNTVGAGRGSTMLWETNPAAPHAEEPPRWVSEQETAATHLERNLKEINAMCQTGLVAARVQILVCENISPKWIEWMDSLMVDCGGRPWSVDQQGATLDERPSPVQIVVASSAQTAETCHDLKSGFMEQRAQDLIFAHSGNPSSPDQKTTDPSLVSSDDHDLYVNMKWNTLVTTRAVSSFLQASADLAAAAASPIDKTDTTEKGGPASNFLVPSFVQVSYVSEENSKIAKWRMHGDFFHPAAWEICKESYETTWIPHSLSGAGGVNGMCPSTDSMCGQWWVYFTELQMSTSPAVYANEAVPAPVQGGSNAFWMLSERHRLEFVKGLSCRQSKNGKCPREPQAVIPLGDLESFLINYTPNTALGKKHLEGRRPGYTKAEEFARDREEVKRRQQLEDEDIEAALFDYTIYPAALFHKDATLKAARKRDAALSGQEDAKEPQQIKSSYYDITITKPRPPVMGWCQAMARRGLCSLFADYFRSPSTSIKNCAEACGMARDFSPISSVEEVEIGTTVAKK